MRYRIIVKEQREASIALRWQQTNAIFRLAMGLGLSLAEEDSEEIEAVRRRWTNCAVINSSSGAPTPTGSGGTPTAARRSTSHRMKST